MHASGQRREQPTRDVLYGSIHVPDFPVQALIRNEPDLRRRPVAVLDAVFPLFPVLATNGLARKIGVRSNMSKVQLDQFPDVRARHRSHPQEESAHGALLDCAHQFTPRVEKTSIDTLTLDLGGLSRLSGHPRAIGQKLFQAAAELGFEAHVAVASNPDAAILAAQGKNGITVLPPGDEAVKMESLPLKVLSPGEDLAETFQRWGLRTFKDLARLRETQISERLGPRGVRLQRLARGEILRPLDITEEKLHFKESIELEHSIDSMEPLTFILSRLLNQLYTRLTARNRTTNTLHVDLKLEGTPAKRFERTLRFPVPIRSSKTLFKLLQLDLDTHRPPAPVIGLTLEAEPVEPRRIQEGLFLPETPEPEKLELTLARISSIVGEKNLGTPVLLDTHRRHAFEMKHFNVPIGPSSPKPGFPAALAALRISRPAQPITVEMHEGRPNRLLFEGKTGKVLSTAGPWNTSGDWWRKDAWNREEWDVEVQVGWRRTLYRIYRDPRRDCWFLDATYD